MSGTDTTAINGLVKYVYDDRTVENLQNMDAPTLKRIKKSPKKPSGLGFQTPVNVQGNQRGQGSQNELEALRTPNSQTPLKFTILPKVFSHLIRLSGLSMDIAKGNEDSFADNATFQMDEGLKDGGKERNAQCFRDGSGVIAQVNETLSADATVTVDGGTLTHFRVGMFIDAFTSTTKEIDSIEVTAVDIANSTITLASAQTATDNAYIYRENTHDNAPTDGKELAGLPLMADDGTLNSTYQGLSRTTYNQLDGITIDASSANLSNDLLQRAISRAKIIGGRKPKRIVSNTSQMRKYLDIVTPLKRFDAKGKMDSGYEEVPTWNGMEWVEDTDCGFADLYMFDPDYVERFSVREFGWDDNGGDIFKWDPGYDAYIAYAKAYDNLGSRVPNAVVRIKSLATPTF